MNNNLLLVFITTSIVITAGCLDNINQPSFIKEFKFEISVIWESNESINLLLPCPIYSHYNINRSLTNMGQPVGPLSKLQFETGNGTYFIQPYNNSFVLNITSSESISLRYEETDSEKLSGTRYFFSELSNKINGTIFSVFYKSTVNINIVLSYNAYHRTTEWSTSFILENVSLQQGWNTVQFKKELFFYDND